MTEQEKKSVLALAMKKIDKRKFFQSFKHEITVDYLLESLQHSYQFRSGDDLEYVLLLSFTFDIIDESFSEILCKILLGDWHYKHEDIAMMLQQLKWPPSVDALYETAIRKFEYLDYDESHALARKCIHALSDLNTKESIEKLQLLTESTVSVIKESAEKQLLKHKS